MSNNKFWSSWIRGNQKKKKAAPCHRTFSPVLEVLEDRTVPAVVSVSGTGGNDTIEVFVDSGDLVVTVNTIEQSRDAIASVDSLTVDGAGGTDTITVTTAVNLTGIGTNEGVSFTATTITINGALSTAGGDISLKTDDPQINAAVNAASGTVTFDRLTAGPFGLGFNAGAAPTLNVTELGRITAGSLVIGNPTAAQNNLTQLDMQTAFDLSGNISGLVQLNALHDAASFITTNASTTFHSLDLHTNDGLTFTAGGTVTTTVGNIVLDVDADGTGAGSGGFNNLLAQNSGDAVINSNTNIHIITRGYNESGTGRLFLNANGGAGTITLIQSRMGTIGVGGGASGDLSFSDAQLSRMTAGTINFGNTNLAQSNTTAINVNAVDLSSIGMVTFNTGGTTTFSGANSFATVTTNGGTTIVGNLATLSGTLNVSSATLSGTGAVGPLTTTSGTNAIVDPGFIGNTSTGILHSGAATFDSSAKLRVLLNSAGGNSSPTAGTDYDQLLSNGAVSLNGATLQVDLGTSFGGATGRSFTILTGTSVTGQFAGFPNPTLMTNPPLLHVGSSFFVVRYTPTSVILDEVPAPTKTTLMIAYSSQPNSARFGETITFTAQVDVDVTGGGPATGGTVTFKNGADTLGTANVNASGMAVFTVNSSNPLAVRTYNQIVAFYSDITGAFVSSQSSPAQSLTVIKADTTTSLAPPSSTIPFGDTGSVVATVAAVSPGAGTPTGDVKLTFTGTANSMQTVSLSGTTASPDLSTLFPGMYTITAQYQGDGNSFNMSPVSSSVLVTVEKVDLGIALAPTSVAFAAPFNFQVTLTGPTALNALPTGTATIKEGAIVLATITSFTGSNGTYTGSVAYAGPNLTAGTHNLTVEYDGSADPNYNTVQISTTLDVNKVDLALTIDPTTVAYASPLTVKLTGNPSLSTLPVGTMTIKEGGTTIGTTTIITGSSGSFSATVPFSGAPLTPGLHALTVAFAGNSDPNYNDGGPTSVDVTVEKVDLSIALAPTSVAFAAPFDFQVTLTGPTSLNALPGGTVMIKEGATVLATISSFTGSNGLYTGSIAYAGPNLNPGSHYLTVEYDGSPDPSYNSVATSAALVVARVDVVIIPDAPAAGSTYGTPRTFTITFSEPVIGFTADDVVLGGTAGATTATVTGSGTVYTVAVSGMRQTGSISLTIPAGSVTDLLGYRNLEPATTTVCFGELVVTGAGSGGAPRVIVYDQVSRTTKFSFLAYEAGFDGGVRVATGDVNGDGTPDIITGAGPGGGPHVRIFDGVDLTLIDELFAYGDGFTGGVFVASGDVNNDGFDDVVTGAGAGGTSHVRIFGGNGAGTLGEFFAYDPGFVGGVQVAVGDVNNDGYADIITGAGAGGGPHVKVIDGTRINERQASGEIQDAALLASFYAYDPGFSGGVFVAARDVNGDGHADILTGAGPGDGPRVKLIDGTKLNEKEADGQIQDAAFLGNFLAYDSQTPTANGESPVLTSGVRVALVDTTGDGVAEILTAPGFGASLPLTVRDARTLNALDSFFVFGDFLGGEFVS